MSDYYNTAGNQIQQDFAGNFFRGQQQGMQRQQFQQQQDSQNQLRNLLPQAIATDDPNQQRNLLGQIAAVDPASAGMATGILDKLSDQQKQAVSQKAEVMVRTLVGVHSIQDPAQKAQAWTQLKQQAIASGVQGAAQLSDDPEQGIAQAYAHVAQLAEIGKELNFGQSDKEKWTPVNVPQSDGSFRLMMTDGQNNWKAPDFGGGQPVPQGAPPQGQPQAIAQPPGQQVNPAGMDDKVAFAMNAMLKAGIPQPQIEAWAQQQMGGQSPSAPQPAPAAPQATQQPASYANAAPPSTAPQSAYASAGLYPGGTPQMGVKPPPANQGEIAKRTKEIADLQAQGVALTSDQQRAYLTTGKLDNATEAPGDPNKTGEDYLATIPAAMRNEVRAIANGDKAAPSASSRSPQAQALLQAVYLYDPTATDVNLPARTATRKDFTSGKSAQNLRSLNQAIGHLGQLDQQIAGTAGHNFQALNAAENWYARQSGDPGITTYEQTAGALAGELTQVFRGNAGAEADLQRNFEQLSGNGSTAQKKAAVRNIVGLLSSRIEELGQQYSQGMGKTVDGIHLLNPHAAQVLQRVSGAPAEAPANDGWTITKVSQ